MGLEIDGVSGIIKNTTSDGDVTIKGNDGGSEVSALTFDMSDAGTATFLHDVKLGDNSKALFGAGSDLQIYHDGSHSYVQDTGTGHLRLAGNDVQIVNAAIDENYIICTANGAVDIYHNGAKKLETTSTGIAVTGEITATGASTITVSDNSDNLTLTSTDADGSLGPNLRFYRNSSSPVDADDLSTVDFEGRNDNSQDVVYAQILTATEDVSDGTEDGVMNFRVMKEGTSREHIRMSGGGGVVINEASLDIDFRVESNGNTHMLFVDAGDDDVRIGTATTFGNNDAGLKVKGGITIGDFTADSAANNLMFVKSRNTTVGSQTIVSNGDEIGRIAFKADDGNDANYNNNVAAIAVQIDAAPGTNDTPGRLIFETTADGARVGTERMRIASDGVISAGDPTNGKGFSITPENNIHKYRSRTSDTGNQDHMDFINANGVVGFIRTSSSSTSYNTSSDYRLKENVVTDWDATTRLKQLKPSRFNFIADADTTVDGFLAHEVSSIVPEAISNTKDETETKTNVVVNANGQVIVEGITEANWTAGKVADEDDNTIYPTDSTWAASKVVPVYQAIDQSKLVPLLVKTIQELEARITALEG